MGEQETSTRELSVCKKMARDAGSCSACSDGHYLVVYEITMRGVKVRLCGNCRDVLYAQLRYLRG